MLARLLDIEDPELPRALSRLVDLLTPSIAAEEVSLGRRKQAQVHESDTSGVRSMRHLVCVPTGKEEGLVRLQRVNFEICLLHSLLFLYVFYPRC